MSTVDNEREALEEALRLRSHQPAGPIYKDLQKRYAMICFKENEELKGIYSLSESHAPSFRIKTSYRYDRIQESTDSSHLTMKKDYVSFGCPESADKSVTKMLNTLAELPQEWTIVQLTSQFNINESMQMDLSKLYTDPLHITVFNCGKNSLQPFCVTVNAPRSAAGDPMELRTEMSALIDENKNLLFNCFGSTKPIDKVPTKQKKHYNLRRSLINSRIKEIITQIEKQWLKEWRCLLTGKFVDKEAEKEILSKINSLLESDEGYKISEKNRYILNTVIASGEHLHSNEILRALQLCIPEPNQKELKMKIYNEIMEISNTFKFKAMKRFPVILIVDEKLDFFPWEMMDVLTDQPVSRMPSLHFIYALYKEHEDSIENGFKLVNATSGSYIINPGLDLKKMEVRMNKFFQYWLPEWKGLVGQTTTSDEFNEYLTTSDIFVYNGHGNGTQFLSAKKIQQTRINSVVLLFGCGSGKMTSLGPFVEACDVFHNYLIACCPCVVGMLWEVTDFDTDLFASTMLSSWISSKTKVHWKFVDKQKWDKGNIATQEGLSQAQMSSELDNEPELLRAVKMGQKEQRLFINKCAIIARGLPVKLVQ